VRLIHGAHLQPLPSAGLRVRSTLQARQLQPCDLAAGIMTILLPLGMPWHHIEAALHAAAPSALPGAPMGPLRGRSRPGRSRRDGRKSDTAGGRQAAGPNQHPRLNSRATASVLTLTR
jgi:hypothetical protein